MNNINEAYQFFLTFPDGQVQVYPEIDELSWKWEYHDKQKFWTLEIDNELVFADNADRGGHNTFAALSALEQQEEACYQIDLTVNYRKSDTTWATAYSGYLPFRSGRYDYSNAIAEIKPVSNDNLRCFLNNWKVERNILDVTERKEIQTLVGEIETQTKTSLTQLPDPPSGVGWVIIEIVETKEYEDQPYAEDPNYTEYEVTFAREFTNVVQTGTEWTLISGTYYRKPAIGTSAVSYRTEIGGNSTTALIYKITTTIFEILDIRIDNGVPLKAALEYLTSFCSLSVISEFFGINSTGEEIYLPEYEMASDDFDNVVLYKASSIIRPDADINATILNVSLEHLIGDLIKKLDLYVFYDSTNSALRIEHESYRSRRRMLNLEQPQYSQDMKGKRVYEYLSADFPLIEYFKDAYEGGNQDFDDANIKYDAVCASSIEEEKETTITCQYTIYDIGAIYQKEDLIEDKDVRNSLVIVALDSNNNIIQAPGDLSGETILNAPFAWANVLSRYQLRNKPLLDAEINGQPTQLKQTKPVRKQSDIVITMKRWDFFENFNPQDRVKTQFGWGGEPQEAEYAEPYNELSLDLAFRLRR